MTYRANERLHKDNIVRKIMRGWLRFVGWIALVGSVVGWIAILEYTNVLDLPYYDNVVDSRPR